MIGGTVSSIVHRRIAALIGHAAWITANGPVSNSRMPISNRSNPRTTPWATYAPVSYQAQQQPQHRGQVFTPQAINKPGHLQQNDLVLLIRRLRRALAP